MLSASDAMPDIEQRAPMHGPDLSDATFRRIAALAHREAGLAIAPAKAAMVRTRLARRLRALKLDDFADYCALVESDDGHDELGSMISALTTNVSHFFREPHHFDLLRERVLPGLVEQLRAGGRVRIWSAGCSNGQEPYTIAMCLRNAGLSASDDVRILATDIDPMVIAHARAGKYPSNMMTGLPAEMRDRHFTAAAGGNTETWQIHPDIAAFVTFKVLNLLSDWPMNGKFDVVFCRNVVIYFDAATQGQLWRRFADHIAPDGWLFLGHSERVSPDALERLAARGMTAYQRSATPDPATAIGTKSTQERKD
jgi:chemotaxis protein methyltransferase CheR